MQEYPALFLIETFLYIIVMKLLTLERRKKK